jgi:hypothetical protein
LSSAVDQIVFGEIDGTNTRSHFLVSAGNASIENEKVFSTFKWPTFGEAYIYVKE